MTDTTTTTIKKAKQTKHEPRKDYCVFCGILQAHPANGLYLYGNWCCDECRKKIIDSFQLDEPAIYPDKFAHK